jgi:adenylosuccinate synthase
MKTALIGLQFGDEGKGKVVTYLLETCKGNDAFSVVARYNGGGNAGHTLAPTALESAPRRHIATHQVPSGIVYPGVYNVMLGGMLVNPKLLCEEIKDLYERQYDVFSPVALGISGLAHVTLDYHTALEALDEQKRGQHAIGTTRRGIGPTAVDKYGRRGIRMAEFVNPDSFRRLMYEKQTELAEVPGIELHQKIRWEEYTEYYKPIQNLLRTLLVDESEVMLRKGNWLYEGAQSVLLDPEFGSYPFVTSTHPAKTPPDAEHAIGVAKAYMTRVGSGPFIARMDETAETAMRGERGAIDAEFGASTGRPRQCGWFDVPATRYSAIIACASEIALTKLDPLNRVPSIKVCTHYELRGTRLNSPPADRFELAECKPVFKEVAGWHGTDISRAQEFKDLPQAAQDYVKLLQDLVGYPITLIGVGPGAQQMVRRAC